MIVGLYEDENGRFDPYLQIYERILDYNGIEHLRLEASRCDFWETVEKLDLVVFHWVYIDRDQQLGETLIPLLEREMGVQCFPDWATFWHYNNKIKQYYLLQSHGFPVIASFPFWDKDSALSWLEDASFPIVNKLSRGALSEDVILVYDINQAKKLVSRMFGKGVRCGGLPVKKSWTCKRFLKSVKQTIRQARDCLLGQWPEQRWQREKDYIFFQQFLPGNDFTTRVTVIGNRAFGFIIHNAKDDFRAYDMQQIDYSQHCLDMDCITIAFKISEKFNFQCMSYDFLFAENGAPLVCEMGYTAQAHDIYKCEGYYDSDQFWHEGHYWPQLCQLNDLLDTDLQQPEIDFQSLHWE